MPRLLAAFVVGLLAVSGCSKSSTGGEAHVPIVGDAYGDAYGDAMERRASVSISDILADPRRYEGKLVRVEGTVTDVCPMRGCWFEMAGDAPGEELRFKVRDGVMEFPVTTMGKYAVAEGVVSVRELSLEETRRYAAHLAAEKGEAFDPATITEGRTLVQLAGTGAVIRDEE